MNILANQHRGSRIYITTVVVIDNTYFESLERISIEKGYPEIIMSKTKFPDNRILTEFFQKINIGISFLSEDI